MVSARVALALAAALLGAACARTEAPARPNVLILLADDLGWGDVGYHGSLIRTPRIDGLAREGVRLERFYAAPMCSPSRAALLTGRWPARLGLLENVGPEDARGLPPEERTLAELFRDAGYATALVGKWHLGHVRADEHPNAQGFERFYGFLLGWVDYFTHEREGELDWQRDGVPLREEGYVTHLLAAEAERLIRARDRTRPFLLEVAFSAPHSPLQVPPGRDLARVRVRREPGASELETGRRAVYTTMVEELDTAIGRLLDVLDEEGLRGDTLVVFASDNGAVPLLGGRNAPLRGEKFEVYEGGVRTPAVLSWPGRLPAGATSAQLASIADLLPTLAAAAGVPLDEGVQLDGEDLWAALSSGEPLERPPLPFAVERPRLTRWALVGPRWKLVEERPAEGGPPTRALYDLEADAREREDRAGAEPERVEELRARLERWQAPRR